MEEQSLRQQILGYVPCNEQEEKDRKQILCYMDRFNNLLTRENGMAHFTASSLVVNSRRDRTLMIYHNLYNSWAWTGGHADGETDLLAVALSEAEEETGVTGIRPIDREIFSLEILPVWGHVKKGGYVSSHLHLNLTYLLVADERAALHVKEDENSAVKWFPLCEMETASSEREMTVIYRKLIGKLGELKSRKGKLEK